MRFTNEKAIKDYKDQDGRLNYSVWDENLPGFGFRVQAGGSKVYYAKYRYAGQQRWLRIGTVDQLNLSDARTKAKAFFSAVAGDVDPAETKAKAAVEAGKKFGTAIEPFLEKVSDELSASYYAAYKMYLEGHFKALHGMSLAGIDRATVSRELRTIKQERGPIAANRAGAHLSKFFTWAMGEGLCNLNPVHGTNKNKETKGNRFLSGKELKSIWTQLKDNDYGRILQLLTLTCQRRNEIGRLEWSEVDFEAKRIELPISRTKTSSEHIVPLSPPAIAILKQLEHNGKYVFGRYSGPFSGWSKAKTELNAQLKIPDWVLHDLRRTGSTIMNQQLGIMPHVVEAILNHKIPGVAGVYNTANKFMYLKEKRAALDKYADYLMKIVSE